MKLEWIAEAIPITNGNMIIEKFDTNLFYNLYSTYQSLASEEKKLYNGTYDYIVKQGGPNLNTLNQNYKKIIDEINQKRKCETHPSILSIDIYSKQDTVIDLLASLETEKYIKAVYQQKKLCVTKELITDTATKIKDSIHQGRCLLQSAANSNMLSKPLIDFYAASAYAYASIVINSPLHKSLDSLRGSHGHTYNHKNETIEFGGDIPSGTFIDLLVSNFYTQIITNTVCFKYFTLPSIEFIQNHKINISLIALLSCVPELQDQVIKIPSCKNIIHKLTITSEVVNMDVSYVFEIGDGREKPNDTILKKLFKVQSIQEINGKYRITVPAKNISDIMPTIYQDIHGNLWYIDPLIPDLYIPEICLHFIIISALCNIMRYSPHIWNNILSNNISSDFSLLISKYLRLFEVKYPMLITQQLTNFIPIIT